MGVLGTSEIIDLKPMKMELAPYRPALLKFPTSHLNLSPTYHQNTLRLSQTWWKCAQSCIPYLAIPAR